MSAGPVFAIETWHPVFLMTGGALIVGSVIFYIGNYDLLDCCRNMDYEEVKEEEKEPETIEIFEDREDVLVLSLK